MKIEKLKKFRQTAYQLLGNGKDATMDLINVVPETRSVYSFVELSLSPVFRRKWSSLQETMEDCRPLRRGLIKLYGKQIPLDKRVIFTPQILRVFCRLFFQLNKLINSLLKMIFTYSFYLSSVQSDRTEVSINHQESVSLSL